MTELLSGLASVRQEQSSKLMKVWVQLDLNETLYNRFSLSF